MQSDLRNWALTACLAAAVIGTPNAARADCRITFDLENPRPWSLSVNQTVEVDRADGMPGFADLERVEFYETIPAGTFFQTSLTAPGQCETPRKFRFVVYCTIPKAKGHRLFREVTYPSVSEWTEAQWVKVDLSAVCPYS